MSQLTNIQPVGLIFELNNLLQEKIKLENEVLRLIKENNILIKQIEENELLRNKIQHELNELKHLLIIKDEEILNLKEQLKIKNIEILELNKLVSEQNEHINTQNERIKIQDERIKTQTQKINTMEIKINILENEKLINIIYKKAFDNTQQIRKDLIYILCDEESDIYKLSRDAHISKLVEHLKEYRIQQYNRYSKVKNNRDKWKIIHNKVIDILKTEFTINNIELFFIITDIKETRNIMSHTTELITLEELQFINKEYAEELYNYIKNIIPTLYGN